MQGRTASMTLIVAGALIVLIGLIADAIGLGQSPGIGLYQVGAIVLGVVVATVGVFGLRRSAHRGRRSWSE